jgi:hypothetical protein
MTKIELTEMVPCPEQEMDVPADDCCWCEYYEGRDNDAICCTYKKNEDE